MLFSEKLDLLMNLSGTSNSALARHINLDASYVSRLRRGNRAPSKKENYLPAISQYFSKFMAVDAFRSGICHALQTPPSQMPIEPEPASAMILSWLNDQKSIDGESIGELLDQVSHFAFPSSNVVFDITSLVGSLSAKETTTYYGNSGKRDAVVTLLATALTSEHNETLYLYSDEAMEWLIGEKKFTNQWAMLMMKVIQKGHRIVIIHTVNRGLDEMLTAIREWMPLYMTGAIEPYYYPRTRDDIYKHTLFVLEGKMALISRSVNRSKGPAAIHTFSSPKTVSHYEKEFQDYLSLCRPLMKILTPHHNGKVLSLIEEFDAEPADVITLREGLPVVTLPVEAAKSMMKKIQLDEDMIQSLSAYHLRRQTLHEENLKAHEHTDLLLLPDRKTLLAYAKAWNNGNLERRSPTAPDNGAASKAGVTLEIPEAFKFKFMGIVGIKEAVYTPESYAAHLSHTIHLLKTYPNYHVILLEDTFASGCMVYIRENVGVLVLKDISPNVLFAINESRLTAAFQDYSAMIAGKVRLNGTERKAVLKRLESLLSAVSGKRSKKSSGKATQ